MKKEHLFDQFPPVTTRAWMDKIHADLKGEDFFKKLVWKTDDGLEVKPFYRMEDIENLFHINTLPGEFPYVRGTKVLNNNWRIRQTVEVSDYEKANTEALSVLTKGIDSLGFIIDNPESVNENNFEKLLRDIHFDIIEINFLSNGKAMEILDIIRNISVKRGIDLARLSGAIEADPIGRLMANGKLCVPVDSGFDYLAALTKGASDFSDLRTIHLNTSHLINEGAGIIQELSFGLSIGCEYLSQLTQRGIEPGLAASKIRFSFGVGADYFPEIAKLRAARLLWSVITTGFQPAETELCKMKIHCTTSERIKKREDPFNNMIRTQTETMAAVLGGTDSLTVEPYDKTFSQHPREFGQRIARNQQLILKEESYFDKVTDPAAGSYYIESLTNLIAENCWRLFLKIEEQGGFLASLESGFILKELAESSALRKN